MTDKDFYDRIDKARSLFKSREAVTRYCHDIRMLEDTDSGKLLKKLILVHVFVGRSVLK